MLTASLPFPPSFSIFNFVPFFLSLEKHFVKNPRGRGREIMNFNTGIIADEPRWIIFLCLSSLHLFGLSKKNLLAVFFCFFLQKAGLRFNEEPSQNCKQIDSKKLRPLDTQNCIK